MPVICRLQVAHLSVLQTRLGLNWWKRSLSHSLEELKNFFENIFENFLKILENFFLKIYEIF